jgi:hypothetical protein
MKNLFSIIAVATLMSLASCGQSKEELAKKEAEDKRKADSITKALETSLSGAVEQATAAATDSAKTAQPAAEEKH